LVFCWFLVPDQPNLCMTVSSLLFLGRKKISF
jgi:hypothetical protein